MQDLIGSESSHLVVESQVASDARPVLSVARFFILFFFLKDSEINDHETYDDFHSCFIVISIRSLASALSVIAVMK